MKVSYYTIQDKFSCRMALITDLHERDPKGVIKKLKEIQPDLICVAGDILERTDIGCDKRSKKDYSLFTRWFQRMVHILNNFLFFVFQSEGNPKSENAYEFFKECSKLAPVFYSLGNHEYYFNEKDQAVLHSYKIHLLDNEFVKYKQMWIGGLSPNVDFSMLDAFEKQDGFKLLLSHHPEYYEKYLKKYELDCILSGHAHGGQIRIGKQGLYAPNQGFFPKYTKGKYGKMIVSAGCANTAAIPRIHNEVEIVCIDIKKAFQK